MRVKYDKIRINRPAQEIYATVLQNGNWETAQYNIQSTYDRSNTLYYDFVDLISFPAKKEFRNFDIRSLASRSEFVHSIERNDFETNVLLTLSRPRFEKYYMTEFDANGQFIIDNREFAQADVSSEYAKVNFALFSSSEYEEDVYIVGAFSDWKAKDKYKLSYDSAESMYTTTVDFKQGFYDYMYGVLDENGQIDTSPFEGNWHETENDYHIIIYFRDFGGEYDRVVDVLTISSGTN